MSEKTEQFLKDRNKLLTGIDNYNLDEVINYCKKYEIKMPEDEKIILAGLHKARLQITSPEITEEMKQKSADWLMDNGFSLEIN